MRQTPDRRDRNGAGTAQPNGCKALQGMPDMLRIRVGDYRIVYTIATDTRVIDVIDVDHRKDVYR